MASWMNEIFFDKKKKNNGRNGNENEVEKEMEPGGSNRI
jgi:hypothetical protein